MNSKKEPRKLSLNRETVRELDDNTLRGVNGAAISVGGCWTPVIWTLPVDQCVPVAVSGSTC